MLWPETAWTDVQHGARALCKSRSFAAVAIITLALGVGANTAIFSILDAVLLNPLPYPDADRMVVIYESPPKLKRTLEDSWPDFQDWRAQNHIFDQMVALYKGRARLSGAGETRVIPVLLVSKSFFSFLGTTPILGRTFDGIEARGGGTPVTVVSYSFWQETLHGDKHAIGSTVTVNSRPLTVIGVLPASFKVPLSTKFDLYLPFGAESTDPRLAGLKDRANHPFFVIAKLRRGIPLKTARVEMNAIMTRLGREYPRLNRGEIAVLIPLLKQVVGKSSSVLLILLAATGFVLLLACANVGHMALARMATRQREFAIRSALGASRWRSAIQLLLEHLPLAVLGGMVGLTLAAFSIKPLVRMYPGHLFRLDSVHLNWSVALFALGACLIAWMLFALAPAIAVQRSANLYEPLKEGSYGEGGGPKGRRVRIVLSTAEVAIALILVVGAGLLLRSLAAVMEVDPGFRADHLLAVSVLRLGPGQVATYYSDALARVSHLPGVRSVGAVFCPPLRGTRGISPYAPDGHSIPSNTRQLWTAMNIATPNYFRTLGTPLIAGRFFTEADGASSTPVAIVNQSMARTISPLRNIIGRRVYVRYLPHQVLQIVGVIADIKQFNLVRPDMPEIFVPFTQWPLGSMTFMVRTGENPHDLAHTIIRSIHLLDKSQPLPQVVTMRSVVNASLGNRKFVTLLTGLFTALALLLASVGVAGVTAYAVAERTHEIGIRVALGAERRQVLWLILRQAIWPTLVGIGVGVAAAWALVRLLTSLLFDVKVHDPLTFVIAALVLAGVSLASCYIPARRATKVDPMVALRHE